MGSDSKDEAKRLAAYDELVLAARRGAISRFASSISHALGTPLNVIAGRAAMIGMAEHSDPKDARENARIIEAQVRNITDLLQHALKFARDGAPESAPTDLRDLASRVISLLTPLTTARGASIQLESGPPLSATLPSPRVLDVVFALASWGASRLAAGETLSLALSRAESVNPPSGERGRARGGASALIELRCPGEPISLAALEHVYEPWLASATADRDTAISLAFAFGIAREHRGFVEAKPDRHGTTFVVCWPI
jgi:signal transduction histidine kinase